MKQLYAFSYSYEFVTWPYCFVGHPCHGVFLPRTWFPVTDMQHYYLARYPTDVWHLANTPRKSIPVKQAYFTVVVCLRVLCHHSVSSWLGPCVIVREPADVHFTSHVQKVWVVRCANGPLDITQWWFLSVPVCAFGIGVRPKWKHFSNATNYKSLVF